MSECVKATPSVNIPKMTLTIITMHGSTFEISDTDECRDAALTFAEFRRGGIMHFTADGEEYFVPASAVDNIKVEYEAESE